MNNEQMIICPCPKKSDACFVQEVNENVKTYQCYGCGFVTNTLMKKDSPFFEEQIELLPNLYKELMGEDEEGKIWMPGVVNIPTKGMVFANGADSNSWKWAAVKSIPVTEEEKEKFPIPGKEGQFYEHRMDMSTLKEFDENDYIEALSFIGVFDSLED